MILQYDYLQYINHTWYLGVPPSVAAGWHLGGPWL